MTEEVNAVYEERNRVVAGLARAAILLGWEAGIGRHSGEDWEDDWRNVIYIELPTGQVSWHIHDRDLPLFTGLPFWGNAWDGHDTEEKYRRLETIRAI